MTTPPDFGTDEPWTWPEARWRPIVEKVRAGRSLKPAAWPDGARCAVALSFDSDHETLTLRAGEASPGRLSQGEYGARAGVPRILRLLDRHAVPATFFVPAVTAMLYPDEQRAVVGGGHEIGIHSWIHERNAELPPKDERDLQMRAADKLEEIVGSRPVGIRTPSWDFSAHTLAITREMGLSYDSSLMADDDPYELLEDGEPTGVVELPVEWIRDDYPYWAMDRFGGLRPTRRRRACSRSSGESSTAPTPRAGCSCSRCTRTSSATGPASRFWMNSSVTSVRTPGCGSRRTPTSHATVGPRTRRERRFLAPFASGPWEGTLDATRFPNRCA